MLVLTFVPSFHSPATILVYERRWPDHTYLQAQDFKKQGTKIRQKMWWENMKIKLIAFGIIIALILLIVLTVCRDFNCW